MKLKFDDKAVKQFYKETRKLGGNKKEIDSLQEKEQLVNYLANNKCQMSLRDISVFEDLIERAVVEPHLPSMPSEPSLPQPRINLKGVDLKH
jgi:hypothetical protein